MWMIFWKRRHGRSGIAGVSTSDSEALFWPAVFTSLWNNSYASVISSAAKQFAEKLGSAASGAKALTEKEDFIAALKALRHPKATPPESEFFSKLFSP